MKSHKCLKKFNDRAQNKFPKEFSRLLKSFQQQFGAHKNGGLKG